MKRDQNIMMYNWLGGLSAVSIILMWNAELHNAAFWIRAGAVGAGWMIFLLIFTPLRVFAEKRVMGAKADNIVITLLLLLFMMADIAGFAGALRRGSFGAAFLFGLLGWGIYSILADLARQK